MDLEDSPEFDVTTIGEMFTNNRTTTYNPHPSRTRVAWAQTIISGNIKLPPPSWWLAEQDSKGRQKSKFAIWNSRYDRARQL
jgi:hypothetical protein